MMLKKIAKPGILIVVAAGVFVFAAMSLFTLIGLKVYHRLQSTPTPTNVPAPFGYCGAQLTDLCVVSFGHDADGKTIINLYVPEKQFPTFYLKLQRTEGESIYTCEENKDVETSVYCAGDALNLGERFTIQILSKDSDTLLAEGKFVLTAILIAAPTLQEVTPQSGTPKPATPTKKSPTPKASPTNTSEDTTPETSQTSTATSYPGYP